MGWDDPIVGSTTLRRPAIASPNYVAGTTGWSINAAGDAEFNNVSLQGTLYLPDGNGGYIKIAISAGVAGILLRPDNDVGTSYSEGEILASSGAGTPYLQIIAPYDQNVGPVSRATVTLTGVSTAAPGIGPDATITAETINLNPTTVATVQNRLAVGTVDAGAPGKIGVGASAAGSLAYSAEVGGADTVPRFVIRGDGLIGWGPGGSTARDTNLYRTAANYLKTDDAFADASHAYGVVTITPVANTPTSTNVTGLSLISGLTYNGYASARTTVVGSTVQGVATTSATATGVTVWVYRTNTTNTNVDWMVVGQ